MSEIDMNAAQLSLWLVLHRKRIKTEEIDFVSVVDLILEVFW
jgi:hypothetical protein